ncbi:MAG: ComEC/Rec2 family competence protein [Bdellovibrionales bacterium]|nr:ComEC/Rec2 family competence protein [Bdellovibrionales bacterium]
MRLLHLFLAFALGRIAFSYAHIAWWIGGILFVSCLVCLLLSTSEKNRWIGLMGAVVAVSFMFHHGVSRFVYNPSVIAIENKQNLYEARVCSAVIPTDQMYSLDLCVEGVRNGNLWESLSQRVTARMYTFVYPKEGDIIRFQSKIKFDDKLNAWTTVIRSDQKWSYVSKHAPTYKQKIMQRAKILLPVPSYQIFQALVEGKSRFVDSSIKNIWRDVGIIHLFVFSGFHVALLYGFAMFIFSFAFCCWIHHQRNFQILVSFCSWLFVTLFLWKWLEVTVPTFRAWAFITIYLFQTSIGFRRSFLFVLIVTLWATMILFPFEILSISSVLSFSAVVGIIWTLLLYQRENIKTHLWKQKVWIHFLVCMAAYLWTSPFLILFFDQWNPLSFVYNIFIVPTFGMVMIMTSFILLLALCVSIPMVITVAARVQTEVTSVFIDFSDTFLREGYKPIEMGWVPNEVIWLVLGSIIITYLFLENQSKKIKIPK